MSSDESDEHLSSPARHRLPDLGRQACPRPRTDAWCCKSSSRFPRTTESRSSKPAKTPEPVAPAAVSPRREAAMCQVPESARAQPAAERSRPRKENTDWARGRSQSAGQPKAEPAATRSCVSATLGKHSKRRTSDFTPRTSDPKTSDLFVGAYRSGVRGLKSDVWGLALHRLGAFNFLICATPTLSAKMWASYGASPPG